MTGSAIEDAKHMKQIKPIEDLFDMAESELTAVIIEHSANHCEAFRLIDEAVRSMKEDLMKHWNNCQTGNDEALE